MKKLTGMIAAIFMLTALFAQDYNAVVNDNNIRYRSNPTLDKSEILGKLNKGDKVYVRARTDSKSKIDGGDDYWCMFYLDNESSHFPRIAPRTAWIYGKYLDFTAGNDIEEFWTEQKLNPEKKDFAERILKSLDKKSIEFCKDSKNAIKTGVYEWNDDQLTFSGMLRYYKHKNFYFTTIESGDDEKRLDLVGIKCLQDIPNPMGVRLGMSKDEVIKIFGDDFHKTNTNRIYYYGFGGFDYDDFLSLHFEFDGDSLSSINIYSDGLIARYYSILKNDCTIIFDRF